MLFGAAGDLAKRKLLPGLFHLCAAGFLPDYRIIGISLDDLDTAAFGALTRQALAEFFNRPVADADWAAFAARLEYVPLARTSRGAEKGLHWRQLGSLGRTG
ncbi:hypothetical protein [Roseateles sp. P5_E7]